MSGEPKLIPEGLMVEVAERLRVFSSPSRLRLIELLAEGPSTPHELSDALGISQQNASKHLKTLYLAGVVSRRPVGANVFYVLQDRTAITIFKLTVDSVSSHLRDLAKLASNATPGDAGGSSDR